jgi:hypothetical protein
MILDSEWFRQSFTQELDLVQQMGFLRTDGALKTIAEFVEGISTISTMLAKLGLQPTLNRLVSVLEFDEFMEAYGSEVSNANPTMHDSLSKIGEIMIRRLPAPRTHLLVRSTFQHPSLSPLCIPVELAEKLSRISRVQITYILALQGPIRGLIRKTMNDTSRNRSRP